MEFQKSVIKIIEERTSCRSFDSKVMDEGTTKKVTEYLNETSKKMKSPARFHYIKNEDKANSTEKLGTYGMISGAGSYIVSVINKNEDNALELGYQFEKIVLFAADLGLGTCWLGGTFNRKKFDEKVALSGTEFIPIVSPIGYAKEKRRFFDSAVRVVVGADNRKPFGQLFFDGSVNTSLKEDNTDPYYIPLKMARLAPSASNKQPWRIIKDKTAYHFYLCRTKGYGGPNYDIQKNDIGVALCHFELTANELGLKGGFAIQQGVNTPAEFEYITSWTESN